jgi:copper/silver efflux system protein
MTVISTVGGLIPIMIGTGTGSEVMKRIAAPMVGGMVSATLLNLIILPALYAMVLQFRFARRGPVMESSYSEKRELTSVN